MTTISCAALLIFQQLFLRPVAANKKAAAANKKAAAANRKAVVKIILEATFTCVVFPKTTLLNFFVTGNTSYICISN